MKRVSINLIIYNLFLVLSRLTYDDITNNSRKKNIESQKNKFLCRQKTYKTLKERNSDLSSYRNNDKKYKINSYISKQKNSINTSTNCSSNNKEVNHWFGEKNKTISNEENNLNDYIDTNMNTNTNVNTNTYMNTNKNKYYNLLYENKMTKLESEIYELKNYKQTMKQNLILFLKLLKNYSFKISSITENISDDISSLTPNDFKEIKFILFHLQKMLNNPKLNEETFESSQCSRFFSGYPLDDDDLTQNNTNTNNDSSYNDKKEVIEEIITKYEKKIKIIENENKDMQNKITILKIENKSLKMELNKEKKNNQNILDKLNKMKQENKDLDKKNKMLDYKCTSYFNKSTKSKYEQKNVEDEIEYKNKIIKYLENLLKRTNSNINDDIYKKNFNKIIDLKKNLKEIIKERNVINNNLYKSNRFKSCNSTNRLKTFKMIIDNGKNNFKKDRSYSTLSSKTYKNSEIKKEIDLLDKEIEQIQTKVEDLIKSE